MDFPRRLVLQQGLRANFSFQPTGGVVVVLDKQPSEEREIIELRASKEVKQAATLETLQDRVNAAINAAGAQQGTALGQVPLTLGGAGAGASGAAAAAGVLTAVDEDGEGAEEAPLPDEFEYQSDDGEGGE
jgi:26S proteasome regulatory subunit N2